LCIYISSRREGIKLDATVVGQLVEGANADIRQIINMLSTWKLQQNTMSFDEGKNLCDGPLALRWTKVDLVAQGQIAAKEHDPDALYAHQPTLLALRLQGQVAALA
jgi:hypothetical protein